MPEASARADHLYSTLPTEDPDFREIVEEFTERVRTQLATMQQAFQTSDLPELARLAHWLKGTAGTAGLTPLRSAMAALGSIPATRA